MLEGGETCIWPYVLWPSKPSKDNQLPIWKSDFENYLVGRLYKKRNCLPEYKFYSFFSEMHTGAPEQGSPAGKLILIVIIFQWIICAIFWPVKNNFPTYLATPLLPVANYWKNEGFSLKKYIPSSSITKNPLWSR